MIEIRKEIVNGIGNVQRTEHVAFVECNINAILNNIGYHYNKLAKVETKTYSLRGQDTYVRYVFQPAEVKSINKAVAYAEDKTKAVVDECNNYIRQANRAYSISNRRRCITDKSLAIKEITASDIMFGKTDAKYCIVVYNEK